MANGSFTLVKHSMLQEIATTLSNGAHFKTSDFEITETATNAGAKLLIRYRFRDGLFFLATIPDGKTTVGYVQTAKIVYQFSCRMAPGEVSTEEVRDVSEKSGLLKTIRDWVGFLHAELSAAPFHRDLVETKLQIDAIIKDLGDISGDYFSRQEAKGMADQIAELEKRMNEHAAKSSADKKEAEARISQIHQDCVELRAQLSSLTKKGWVGSMVVRVATWMQDPSNEKVIQATASLVKGLLPPKDGSGG